jgi:hypothetical protein
MAGGCLSMITQARGPHGTLLPTNGF